ncbi:MAG: hypothetical protein IJM25_11745 [Eubacterium sp.]|nr:hypothetical protein [Eubacterium sp.]
MKEFSTWLAEKELADDLFELIHNQWKRWDRETREDLLTNLMMDNNNITTEEEEQWEVEYTLPEDLEEELPF